MRKILVPVIGAVMMNAFLAASGFAGALEDGRAAAAKGEYDVAMKLWRPLAEKGDATAQSDLGLLYDEGLGIKKDPAEAAKWYRLAADQGDAAAQNNLAFMYVRGISVEQDYVQAAHWYRKAADQGAAEAQYNLAHLYVEGRGVPQDIKEAADLYRKAAEQGDPDAQNRLGLLYVNGEGVAQDRVEGYKWIALAVKNTPMDDVRAVYQRHLDDVARPLTPEQISEGEKRVEAWTKK